MDLRDKFKTAYTTARYFVMRGSAAEAREYVLEFLYIARDLCAEAVKNPAEQRKLVLFIAEWTEVAKTLREKGVTYEVKQKFGITAVRGEVVRDVSEHSQGWCADVFEKFKPAVVTVSSVCAGNTNANGTGFIISKNGYLLTNDHVVYDEGAGGYAKKISMRFEGGKKSYKTEIIDSNKKWDIALLRFDTSELADPAVVERISDYSSLKQGADVLVIGNAFSFGLAPFTGTVRFTSDEHGNLVYTAPSNPGDSGGPVFNRFGQCVGINKSITAAIVRDGVKIPAQGLTNATPMSKINEYLTRWSKEYGITI